METKKLYINTIGCQMNVYDSEQIAARLAPLGYRQTATVQEADLVIVNTCAIRAKAEQKAFSFLGRLVRLKEKKPALIIGVGGCVAQQEGQKILQRAPYVDLVFGTRAIERLPAAIRRIASRRCRIIDVDLSARGELSQSECDGGNQSPVSRFVTIMRGCDNFCSYCVVPFVRGRETSRDPGDIVKEIRMLVKNGTREVTLLGQNVNSYGKKEGLCTFPELLQRVNAIDDLLRIRFTTSHPRDFNGDLIQAFGKLDKLCRHIHLPVQSGSDRVLRRMNRKYSRQLYLDKIAELRDTCADVAVTTDIIVGFPGETETDFDQTLDLLRTVQFDGLFAFKYSDRPQARAAGFADKVSRQKKKMRLQILLDLQEKITRMKNQSLVGSWQEILIEGLSKNQLEARAGGELAVASWTGRTSTNKIVNFFQAEDAGRRPQVMPGRLLDVKIEKAFSHSLWGKAPAAKSAGRGLKGAQGYAA